MLCSPEHLLRTSSVFCFRRTTLGSFDFFLGEMHDPASALAGMLPFDSIGLYEQPKPRFIFKMPRVVPDQKGKFESDELFRRLSRESEVKAKSYSNKVVDAVVKPLAQLQPS